MALRDSPGAAAPSVLYLCHAHAASSISSHTSPRRRQDMSRLPARAAATNDDNAAAPPQCTTTTTTTTTIPPAATAGEPPIATARRAHSGREKPTELVGKEPPWLAPTLASRFTYVLPAGRLLHPFMLGINAPAHEALWTLFHAVPPTRSLESPSRPPVITHPGKRVIRNLRPENFSMPCFGWAQIARVELPRMACRAESQTASHQRRSQSPQCPARPPLVRHEPRLPRDCQSELNSARYKETQPCTAFVTKSAGS
ncbi:hypothetical protein ACCO45_013825 [Purpureocillium lilacinum]|uniref:Uncharacterized protein n=1 Tax=Purpureocillium lilacinum TaxID=33203 RepID=A0ACC4D7P1_PURLI